MDNQEPSHTPSAGSPGEVLRAALALGLTSFGGPIAHIGYFRREYVERRRWLDEAAFVDLVALCQFLPGPASSQLGIAVGTRRAGLAGGLAAWLGFTLPSGIILLAFGLILTSADLASAGWIHGLKLAAVAVVGQAVWGMARALTPDPPRQIMALAAAAVVLIWSSSFAQIALIAGGALIGRIVLAPPPGLMAGPGWRVIPRGPAIAFLVLFVVLLAGLPVATGDRGRLASLFARFYQSGALVFGGGHVVLPLLDAAVVDPGWVTHDQFLTGYGAAQAMPGPLFTIAAYLGAVAVLPGATGASGQAVPATGPEAAGGGGAGVIGGIVALAGIFLPSFLLVFGTLPFWDRLRRSPGFRRALAGTNAVVVGLLLAAFWDPVLTGAIRGPGDVAAAVTGLVLLATGRVPPIAVVALSAGAGQLLGGG